MTHVRYLMALLVGFVMVLGSLSAPSGQEIDTIQSYDLVTSTDEQINLDDFTGEVFLMLAMTTTCSSCKLQNDHLKAVRDATDGLTILSVAMDPDTDSIRTLSDYKVQEEIPWTVALDESGELTNIYQIFSYPQLFLFDDAGQIAKRWKQVAECNVIAEELRNYMEVAEVEQPSLWAPLFENKLLVGTIAVLILILPTRFLIRQFSRE